MSGKFSLRRAAHRHPPILGPLFIGYLSAEHNAGRWVSYCSGWHHGVDFIRGLSGWSLKTAVKKAALKDMMEWVRHKFLRTGSEKTFTALLSWVWFQSESQPFHWCFALSTHSDIRFMCSTCLIYFILFPFLLFLKCTGTGWLTDPQAASSHAK